MRAFATIETIKEVLPIPRATIIKNPRMLMSPGKRFGRLIIIMQEGRSKDRGLLYRCLCNCGNEVIVRGKNLRSGITRSCGCYQKDVVSALAKRNNVKKRINKLSDFKFKQGSFIIDATADINICCFIYKITNCVNNKIYIGQTSKTFKYLLQRYNREVVTGVNRAVIHAIKKYGRANFKIEILEQCPVDKLNEKEMGYIAINNSETPSGYNITKGGDGTYGYKRSPTSIAKQIAIQKIKFKGSGNPFFGRKHTEQTRNKIIESNRRRGEKRRSLTEEHI
jgi:group I intron endonuclease